jgi:hypothetical protein
LAAALPWQVRQTGDTPSADFFDGAQFLNSTVFVAPQVAHVRSTPSNAE